MSAPKPSMLIAEDSEIAEQLQILFADRFEVVLARDGSEAFAEVECHERFDICLLDIIMPIEKGDLDLRAADETGIRLIQEIVAKRKCGRFLVLTVRWDVEETIEQMMDRSMCCRVLLKQEADADSITQAVDELMQFDPGPSTSVDALMQAVSQSYNMLLGALREGELAKEELFVALQSLRQVLTGPILHLGLKLKNHKDSHRFAEIAATLQHHVKDFGDKNLQQAISGAKTAVAEVIQRHGLGR